ncbi:GntR family transcriptional regulator [Labedaea rhizosphaerae]|uniref:GntR family transcriptional regulator n=1 Tax=Labedaea rhizosphaerae TaxID=598644 RepID=A0A4R6RUN6_LABRH|nr:GntR family transcriptional regulator [Labedaea rhizosphaerae]TDP90514.1 GntR family transcriptional regulator [Labedaea rhizosphaerae]
MIDKESGVPAYRQVADTLRDRVATGQYPPGHQVPSERDLVDEFGVSRPTIRQAIELLRSDGVLVAEHGRGIFVRQRPTVRRLARNRLSRAARDAGRGAFLADADEGGWTPSVSVRIRFEPAAGRVAELLQLAPGAEVTIRDRIMRADGEPVQLAVSHLPRELTQGTVLEDVDTGDGGTYARLEEAGHRLRFEELVGARMPTSEERTQLGLTRGTPVLTVTRVATSSGRPVEVTEMVMSADLYELLYDVSGD